MLRALLLVLVPMIAYATPAIEPGIPRELARWRAATYADVAYRITFAIAQPVVAVRGEIDIEVTLKAAREDIVLDWRVSNERWRIEDLSINGQAVIAMPANDHIVIGREHTRPGKNVVHARFSAPIAVAGTALTLYRDREDGAEYVYSLLVPADASTLFPCFDQPDLKARFELALHLPKSWNAVSNSSLAVRPQQGHFTFKETAPISTYLFAFAAGPLEELRDGDDTTRLFVRRSRVERARAEVAEVLRLNREAVRFFARYFEHPFPFEKYDLVLLPEFPYGGMEHAGATFLREESVLFPSLPSANDLLRRAQLVFHETCHQWFGDLVTMRWFDDLWLKEGFANLMAAKAAATITPQFNAWNAFHALKVAAYRTDITQGTTPIWQDIANLSAAKSAYGSIVYSKAPGVLRQAEFYLGEDAFLRRVRSFVERHAYGAADWSDLVRAFEQAAGRPLQAWADAWVKRRGMPTLRVIRQADGALRLTQEDSLGESGLWPMKLKLVAVYGDGTTDTAAVTLDEPERVIRLARPGPRIVYANFEDWAYGRFLLDDDSRDAVFTDITAVQDGFLRALLLDALWDSVREAELDPARYLELALEQAAREQDEVTVAGLLARVQTALRWYLGPLRATALTPRVEAKLVEGMMSATSRGARITYLRSFVALAASATGRTTLKQLLAGAMRVPGVELASRDRFRIIERLLALGDAGAVALLARQMDTDSSDDGRRYAYGVGAAAADPAVKQRYFDAFLTDSTLAESWIEEALGAFNTVEHAALTEPYLAPALAVLPEIKSRRKIFFVNDWLGAFLGGQVDSAAVERTRRFLSAGRLDADLRLKVLEHLDPLERTVRIRARFADQAAR